MGASPPAVAVLSGPVLLKIAQAAHVLNISDKTVQRRIKSRDFPSVLIGTTPFVPLAWINDLVADAIRTRRVQAEEHGRAWTAARKAAS